MSTGWPWRPARGGALALATTLVLLSALVLARVESARWFPIVRID